VAWILDAVGCSFSCREGSAGPPLKNVMLLTFTFEEHFSKGIYNNYQWGLSQISAESSIGTALVTHILNIIP
jgi:hypothetical protein